jgi:hypothetical protein
METQRQGETVKRGSRWVNLQRLKEQHHEGCQPAQEQVQHVYTCIGLVALG